MKAVSEKYGVEIWPVYFDVTNEAQVKQAVQAIRRQKKDVDILAAINERNGEYSVCS